MNGNSVNDGVITVEHSFVEQHPHVDNYQRENSTKNQSNSEQIVKVLNKKKISPKNPTPLEYSCWSTHHTATAVGAFAFFTSLAMIVGVLVVCLTSPKGTGPKCVIMLNSTVQYSTRDSSHPQSVAVGDFNNDSQIDIVVAYSGTDNVGIFLGYGNTTFAIQMTYSTGLGSTPNMVAVGNFNNDNRLDIAVANFGTNNIGILLGNGDGNFKSQSIIQTTPSRPLCLAVGDFNNDTQLDIAFASYGTNSIGVLLGFGNGNFTKQTTFSTGYDSLPYSIAVGDFNNDNKLDIAVANSATDNVGVLLGYGNGTFAMQTTYTTGISSHPYSIVISDLNNDTELDIAVVNSGTDNLSVLFGYGNGSFTVPTFYSTGSNSNPIYIAIADFNNDDILDIIVANNGTGSVRVFLGHRNGTFANQITYSTGPYSSPYSIGIADFNNDARLDIAIANQQNNNVMIFNGYSNETLANQITYPTGISSYQAGVTFYPTGDSSEPYKVAVGDFNNDSWMDIAVANVGTSNVGVLLGCGDGNFSSQTTYSTGDGSSPHSIAIGDFNNDSRLDIAVANVGTDNVGVLLGYGDGTFSNQMTYPTGPDSSPFSIAVGDFNNDRRLDIAVANYNGYNIGVLLGYGNGTFSTETTYPTGLNSNPYKLAIGDFNDDSHLDIVVANSGTDNVGLLLGYGDGTFSNQTTYPTGDGSFPVAVAIDDFNNDSRSDIVVVNYNANNIAVLFGYGNGSFSSQATYSTGDGAFPDSVAVADFNNDSRLDIVVTNSKKNNVGILLGYDNGTFSNQTIYSTGAGSSPRSVAVGDFNNDSRLDITVANFNGTNIVVLLGYGNGTFPWIPYSTSVYSYPDAVTAGDFNNDSRLDIAVANSGGDNVGILLGYGNGTFESLRTYFTGYNSGPISVAVGDFNNDDRLDIAVANYGTNNIGILLGYGDGTFASQTTYPTGDDSSPRWIAIGDFNNDSRLDIAVANVDTNNVGVLLGYGDGTFSSQTTYSTGAGSSPCSIAVGDFNNNSQLDIAVANFYGGNIDVFLGHGDGTFRDQTIFPTGVASYPSTLAVGDFNNDNNLDIAVGNSHSGDEENVFILLGNGNGSFSANGKYLTGIYSNPYSVVVGNFNNDNQLDIAVANRGTNNLGIFLGYGDGTFSSQTTYPTNNGSNPRSIAIGDFNEDNLTDVAVANHWTFTVGVFLAFINTSFEEKTTFSTGSAASPRAIAIGDFTDDEQLDVVVANYGTHNIGLLRRYENGSFVMQTAYSGDLTFYPVSMVVTRFNNDSRLDIVVANSVADNVILLFGEGNGTFGNHTAYSTGIGSNPQSVAIGDFDNDDRADIVVAHSGAGSVGVLLKTDPGAFESLRTFSTGSGSKPEWLAVGDFDNDGQLDITVADNTNASIGFFFGFSNGTFSSQSTISVGEGIFPVGQGIFPLWVGVGDFNNDKRLDVIVANNIPPSPMIVLLGNGSGSFRIKTTDSIGLTNSGAVGDFNSDGRLDFAASRFAEDTVTVVLGYGDGTFGNQMNYLTGGGSNPRSVTVGDFNNDNQLDIAVANFGTNNIAVLLGYGNGIFTSQTVYSTGDGSSPYSVAVADFNNDKKLDIAVANFGTNNIGVFLGYGDGSFSIQMIYPTGDGSAPRSIAIADFNNDGRLDIAVANYGSGNVGILLGYVNGTFFNEITYVTGENSSPVSVAVGDFNNDGRLDITVSDIDSENIGIFLGYASENFISTAAYPIGDSSQPVSIAVGDFNNDTRLDVAVADRGTNEVIILHGSGYGTFSSQANYSTSVGSDPSWVAVGDFNQDYQLDIVVVNSGTNNIGVLLGYRNGTFPSPTMYSTGYLSLPVSLAVGHFDNDTHLDIAVAIFGTNNVGLFLGYGNGSFASPLFFASGFGSHPFAVAFADLNKDDSTDIVVCNNGYSTIEILSKVC